MKQIDRRRPRKIDDAKLCKLWPSKMTDEAIAQAMGHDRNTLRRRAIKLGLPARRELWAAKP